MTVTDQRIVTLTEDDVRGILVKALRETNPDFVCVASAIEIDLAGDVVVTLTPLPRGPRDPHDPDGGLGS